MRSTNGFQSVKETSLWQDRSLIKILWRYDQELLSGVGASLLVLGRGLHSTDAFKNVMVISLTLDASLVKFS